MKNKRNKLDLKCITIYFFILLFIVSCNKTQSNNNTYEQCNDTAKAFDLESLKEQNVSFYENKKQLNRLRFLLNDGCDDYLREYAGYYLFFSYLIKEKIYNTVNLDLSHLSKNEREEALLGLRKASMRKDYSECKYILAIFLLNGTYLDKDTISGINLLESCNDLEQIKLNLLHHRINVHTLDSLYYIPDRFKLNP